MVFGLFKKKQKQTSSLPASVRIKILKSQIKERKLQVKLANTQGKLNRAQAQKKGKVLKFFKDVLDSGADTRKSLRSVPTPARSKKGKRRTRAVRRVLVREEPRRKTFNPLTGFEE